MSKPYQNVLVLDENCLVKGTEKNIKKEKFDYKKYFERQDLSSFEAKNRLCFFGFTDEPFASGSYGKNLMTKFYLKIAKSGVGVIFTGGVNPLPSKNKRFRLDYTLKEKNFYADFLTQIHEFGTKIFFKINSAFGRADDEHLLFNLFPVSSSRLKSAPQKNLPVFRLTDGKINKLANEMAKCANFATSVGFDGLLFDDTMYSLMGELSSAEFNRRRFGYYNEYEDFSTELLKKIQSKTSMINIFYEISLKSFIYEIYKDDAKKILSAKGINYGADESLALSYLEKLVALGVTGFVFKFGTYETEFLSEFNSLSAEFSLQNLLVSVDEYFEKKGILNKFGKKVTIICSDNFELGSQNELISRDNFIFDVSKLILANENYLNELSNLNSRRCIRCSFCDSQKRTGKIACTINPAIMLFEKNEQTKSKVAVVGGGISGIITSINSAKRGAKVDLFEEKQSLGQNLLCEEIFGFDEHIKNYNNHLKSELEKLEKSGKISVHLSKKFQVADVGVYDAVVCATGSHEYNLNISGAVLKNVKSIYDVLLNKNEIEDKNSIVIMVSSEISLKTAIYLLEIGKRVSLIIERPECLFSLSNGKLTFYLYALKKLKANIYPFVKLKRIEADFVELIQNRKIAKEDPVSIILNSKSGKKYSFEAKAKCIDMDLFLFEPQRKPNNRLLYDLVSSGYSGRVLIAGDAMKTFSLDESILSAFYVSENI